MAKKTEQFVCSDCGENYAKWQGQCNNCQAWNTIKVFHEAKIKSGKTKLETGVNLARSVISTTGSDRDSAATTKRIITHIDEVDRVLGAGFFPGSVILFGGTPGVGKSTLALQMFLQIEGAFYFSGEESKEQVLSRAERLMTQKQDKKNKVFSTHSLEDIISTIQAEKPPFVVIDSIQMVGLEGTVFGSITQIKENAELLVKLAKAIGTTILLIGHVTKADEIAGPRILEHMVDVVLRLDGDNTHDVRILRSPKNRFGSTLEVGVFSMQGRGLKQLKNPSEFFLAERAEDAYGSAITVMREGSRNFLMEIQVLTVKTNFGQPRRTSHGIDMAKFHLLLAVISKFTPFKCHEYDAYISVVGGMRIKEPASDLAVAAAILSSRLEKEIPADTVVLGEVGLSGEVRSVSNLENRLKEAAKLGFKRAVVPRLRGKISTPTELKIQEVKNVAEILKILFGK